MSELADFVLNAFRQAGGIIEPPAYGVYEALLPDNVARRWSVPAYGRLAFAGELPGITDDDVTVVGYGHPLMETLVDDARAEPACAQVYINDLRLDKGDLLALAHKTFTFSNARLTKAPRKSRKVSLCHYVRFNFKAALITDEKRERLVSVVMDAQAGYAVPELTQIEHLARLDEETTLGHLTFAPVRWTPGPGHKDGLLSRPVLEGLLERATRAALDELAKPLEKLRRRAARYLELDRARLTGYYDDITRDLQRRIERTSDADRRTLMEDKLVSAQSEREAKLADVEAKYRLRVELELVNIQIIVQPKILLPVSIGNRKVQLERAIVWDPLLHHIEPLACDVCGQAATRLALCNGGHLAHKDCLLPEQCVDCKRVYCRLCADQMGRCVVCDRPVCIHSLNHCDTCERVTCHEHVGLCHAADGEPASLAPEPVPPAPVEPMIPEPEPAPPPVEKEEKPPAPKSTKRKRGAAVSATRTARSSAGRSSGIPAPYKIEVYADPRVPQVNGFVLTKGKKQIAVRSWELVGDDILVTCQCEKWYRCPVDRTVIEPTDPSGIEAQIEEQIEILRLEYGISAKRVFRYAIVRGASRQVSRVPLKGEWKKER